MRSEQDWSNRGNTRRTKALNDDEDNYELFARVAKLHQKISNYALIQCDCALRQELLSACQRCSELLDEIRTMKRIAIPVRIHIHGEFQDQNGRRERHGGAAAVLTCLCGCGYQNRQTRIFEADSRPTQIRMANRGIGSWFVAHAQIDERLPALYCHGIDEL